jgi:hypothetical protein
MRIKLSISGLAQCVFLFFSFNAVSAGSGPNMSLQFLKTPRVYLGNGGAGYSEPPRVILLLSVDSRFGLVKSTGIHPEWDGKIMLAKIVAGHHGSKEVVIEQKSKTAVSNLNFLSILKDGNIESHPPKGGFGFFLEFSPEESKLIQAKDLVKEYEKEL